MVSLTAGQDLTPRYKLVRRFGKNGIAEAWLVDDVELGRKVVAKILPEDAPPSLIELLKREFTIARKLDHENIVRMYDLIRSDDYTFFTMAHVDGVGLSLFEGRPIEEILPLLVPLADALDYAHRQGVVHRDVKPSNVLVDSKGVPHLADFGVAGLLSRADLAGGGTQGYSSPEQLAGAEPSVGDDVYAFGALALKLTTGESPGHTLPDSVPARFRPLLSSLLSPDPARRPDSMSVVRKELEALRDRKAVPEVKPPLRISPPAAPLPVREAESRVGWKTVAAFAVLLSAAAFVFAVLPGFVEERRATPEAPFTVAEAPDPASEESVDLRGLAREKTAAEEARERALRLRKSLTDGEVARWGGNEYREALGLLEGAESSFEERDYAKARVRFVEAANALQAILDRAGAVVAEAIETGERALERSHSSEARDRFTFALGIEPDNARAKKGLARAESLDEVLEIVADGEARERRGDLKRAAESYRRAAALDPLVSASHQGLARVNAASAEKAFTAAMSEAVAALGRGSFEEARASFERAKAIRPGAREIEDGLAQVAEGILARDVATHQRLAQAHERNENWREAAKEYEGILALDATIRLAQEGKARTAARILIEDKLDFQIAHADRLSDGNALREASLLLEESRGIENPGPKHRDRVAKLEALVQSYAIPVTLELISDELTEVTVTRVGRLGRFDRRTLELRPGRYTVVGSRSGYRDVRRDIEIEPGNRIGPVVIRCEEKI
jgi:tetratricopeptide (TPR) repeat protein